MLAYLADDLVHGVSAFVDLYGTAGSLYERNHTLLQLNLHPLHELQVQDYHFVVKDPTFSLSTIDDHGLFVDNGAVVFPGARRESGRFALLHKSLICIELQELVCAFTNLSLRIEHEASSENVDFAAISYGCMALPALYRLYARIWKSLPNDLISNHFGKDDLLAGIKVQATDQVHVITDGRQGGAFARCRHPQRLLRNADFHPETLPLLHSLNIVLQSAHQLVYELVAWDIFSGVCRKCFIFFFIARLDVLVYVFWLWSSMIYPLCYDF